MPEKTPAVKVTIGEETHEIGLDAIEFPEKYGVFGPDKAPEGYVSKDWMKSEIDRRTNGMAKKDAIVEELEADDEFFQKAASKRGIQLDDNLKPVAKLSPEQIRQQREQWETEALKPALERATKAETAVEKARRDVLIRDVMQAAQDANVKPGRMKSLFGDGPSEFVKEVASRFAWDEERGSWYFKDAAGNPAYADAPTQENPFAGPKKLLEQLRMADKDNEYFEDVRQRGSGGDVGGGSGVRGGTYRISREDARNTEKYRSAKAAADKAGVQLEIVD